MGLDSDHKTVCTKHVIIWRRILLARSLYQSYIVVDLVCLHEPFNVYAKQATGVGYYLNINSGYLNHRMFLVCCRVVAREREVTITKILYIYMTRLLCPLIHISIQNGHVITHWTVTSLAF